MSDADSATMSIKDRIAALQKGKGGGDAPIDPPPTKPKRSNALADRIAALQCNAAEQESSGNSSDSSNNNARSSKVGKLKLPGGVPIIMPGGGPPPSLLKKQQEREVRKQKLIEDAQKDDAENADKSSVVKLKLPPGSIKMIIPGCPPPTTNVNDTATSETINHTTARADEAIMSRPTMPKRRPRNRA